MEKTIASPPAVWQESIAKTVTFVVTEDCQLRCRYCYLVGKNSRNRMSFDTARRSIDYLVENPDLFPKGPSSGTLSAASLPGDRPHR
jgi:uncharacterized protein